MQQSESRVEYKFTRSPWTATPALIKVKETEKISSHFYMQKKIFKTCAILWESAQFVLKISTEKPENCQLSDSFKENVRGLIKLNAT